MGNAVSDAGARAAHCTFVVVGAGYAGAETAAAMQAFTQHALCRLINLRPEYLRWILADVAGHVLPELGPQLSSAALRTLHQRRIEVRLQTSVEEVRAGSVRFSDGQTVGCRTLVWTAGVRASPLMTTLGLDTGRAGRLVVTPDLQAPQRPDVFAAGDAAAVPDLTGAEAAITPPTAQHAQRQGIALAGNIVRSLRDEPALPYRHHDLGLVVDLGGVRSVARPLGYDLRGLPAQVITRGYHLNALPTMRARGKAAANWLTHALLGEDFVRVGLGDTSSLCLDDTIGYLSADDTPAAAADLKDTTL